ncbi:MAG: hypothetical protein MJ211_14995 [Bacteroidales bacterium]|nr:hypothetical protein [Bacteroidales bacterium]
MKKIFIFVAIIVASSIGVKKANIDVNNCELLIDDIEMIALAQQETPSNKSGSITIYFDANGGSSKTQNRVNTSANAGYSTQNDSASIAAQAEWEREKNKNNSDTSASVTIQWNGVEMTAEQAAEMLKAFLH